MTRMNKNHAIARVHHHSQRRWADGELIDEVFTFCGFSGWDANIPNGYAWNNHFAGTEQFNAVDAKSGLPVTCLRCRAAIVKKRAELTRLLR